MVIKLLPAGMNIKRVSMTEKEHDRVISMVNDYADIDVFYDNDDIKIKGRTQRLYTLMYDLSRFYDIEII